MLQNLSVQVTVFPNPKGHIARKRPSEGFPRANIRPFRASLSMPVEAWGLHQRLASRAASIWVHRSGGRTDMDEVKKRLESELNGTVERLRQMGGPLLSVDVMNRVGDTSPRAHRFTEGRGAAGDDPSEPKHDDRAGQPGLIVYRHRASESGPAEPGEGVPAHPPALHAQRPRHCRLGEGLLERTSRPHGGKP